MISESERRVFISKRRPMTVEELNEAREVLCAQVEPETSVAYHFTMLVLEVERAQAVLALAASPPAASPPGDARDEQTALPCGCVTCVCKTDGDRCLGCGAKESRACFISRTHGGPRHAPPAAHHDAPGEE